MMSSISVEDVLLDNVFTVRENDTLSQCLELFKKEGPAVLSVVDEKGKHVGVIASRWIMRMKLDPRTTKVKTLMRPAPKIEISTSLSKAAKIMIESGVRHLPVFEGKKLRGFVTDESIIHGAVTEEWGNTPIEQIMTKAPSTIEANRTLGAVLSVFRDQGVSHMPVMDKGKLVGMISTQDIVEHIYQPNQRQTLGDIKGEKIQVLSIPAKGVMVSPVETVSPYTNIREAEKKMHDLKVHSLPVMADDRLVGIVTKLDYLEPLAQMEFIDRRLTIQFSVKGMEINPMEKQFMMEQFESFARKYSGLLESGTLFVYMKHHGNNNNNIPLIHLRLNLRTVLKGARGFFVASGEGFGVEPTFRVALDRLDKRILRSKELDFDTKYQKEYLKRYGFPEL